jgi:predicted metal-dependent peptidase|tara:strand:+ start:397 stop:618 length:222 start_codon:yes stop_codon:yes gene_type:complete
MAEEEQKEEVQNETDKVKVLEEETKSIQEAIAENENAKAKAKLGGVSLGAPQEEEKKEETPTEYKDRVLSGNI